MSVENYQAISVRIEQRHFDTLAMNLHHRPGTRHANYFGMFRNTQLICLSILLSCSFAMPLHAVRNGVARTGVSAKTARGSHPGKAPKNSRTKSAPENQNIAQLRTSRSDAKLPHPASVMQSILQRRNKAHPSPKTPRESRLRFKTSATDREYALAAHETMTMTPEYIDALYTDIAVVMKTGERYEFKTKRMAAIDVYIGYSKGEYPRTLNVEEGPKDAQGNIIQSPGTLVPGVATAKISHLEFSDGKEKIKSVTVDELFTFEK